ncbi:hypothetical protein Tco_0018343 [Tanacetum coccineum]
MPVQTRRQLATDPEMCMLRSRLKVWELSSKPIWQDVNKAKVVMEEQKRSMKEDGLLFASARRGSLIQSARKRSLPSKECLVWINSQGTTRACHKVVRLGINPMIQPEPEDLPKDNPKLEIAVLRWQSAQASEY